MRRAIRQAKRFGPSIGSGLTSSAREEWWAISDITGEVFGPFDPGVVWFETPLHVRGSDLLRVQRVADLILNESHAGWERLQRALAFMQPNGLAVYRRFMESGALPLQTPALGLAGGLDVPGYLGDGAATGSAGLHIDDSKNGTTVGGSSGGAGKGNDGGKNSGATGGAGGGGGGGYGTSGSRGSSGNVGGGGRGGGVVSYGGVWECMRANDYTRDLLGHGSGGGRGGFSYNAPGAGGSGGRAYIEIVNGTLTTTDRSCTGSSGRSAAGERAGGGGGGAGGLWLGIASSIVHGTGTTINCSGGGGGSGGSAPGSDDGGRGGSGGDGRVIQVYFDSKATLTVNDAVEDQFRILRSVPIGQNTFL